MRKCGDGSLSCPSPSRAIRHWLDDHGILFFFLPNLLCAWSQLTILRPHLMKQIKLENGSLVPLGCKGSVRRKDSACIRCPALLGGPVLERAVSTQTCSTLGQGPSGTRSSGLSLRFSSVGGGDYHKHHPLASVSRELCGAASGSCTCSAAPFPFLPSRYPPVSLPNPPCVSQAPSMPTSSRKHSSVTSCWLLSLDARILHAVWWLQQPKRVAQAPGEQGPSLPLLWCSLEHGMWHRAPLHQSQ